MSSIDRLLPLEVRRGDDADLQRARLTVNFGYTVAIFALIVALVRWRSGAGNIAAWFVFCALMGFLTPVVMRLSRSVRVASHWVVGMVCMGLCTGQVFAGGVEAPGLLWTMIIPLTAAMLLGSRAGAVWTAITVAHLFVNDAFGHCGVDIPIVNDIVRLPRHKTMISSAVLAYLAVFTCACVYELQKLRFLAKIELARQTAVTAHAAARVVLDNVDQALIIVAPDGAMAAERSREADRWFGAPPADASIFTFFDGIDASFAEWFRVMFPDLFEDVLPLELVMAQLPAAFSFSSRHFSVKYTPIEEAGRIVRVLLVITDVTDHVVSERVEEAQRELLSVVKAIMEEKSVFVDFFEEMGERVARITSQTLEPATERMELHTLKGNAPVFGLTATARLCHEIEDEANARDGVIDASQRSALRSHWEDVERRVEPFIRSNTSDVCLSQKEYDDAVAAALAGESAVAMLERMRSWALEPTRNRLDVYDRQVRTLAARLGRGVVRVRIEDGGVRLPRERFGDLWSSLVHAVRNAVDHGIETPDARRAANKSPIAEIVLGTRIESGELVLEISDDGAGIDWGKLALRAGARGLPTQTREDLVDALFADGMSTRDHVSDISGRGVGMTALKRSIDALGGRVQVTSEPGQGTAFRFRIPVAAEPPPVPRRSFLPPSRSNRPEARAYA